jgi:hypothetical protein
MKKTLYSLALLLAGGFAFAHSGGTDTQGCHTNRETSDYHCHGSKGSSVAAAPQSNAPRQSAGPICYVGLRGGTYTITKSGRKNYSGC